MLGKWQAERIGSCLFSKNDSNDYNEPLAEVKENKQTNKQIISTQIEDWAKDIVIDQRLI